MNAQEKDRGGEALSARESVEFELLYLLEKEPVLSQRELAERLGISIGRVNYCLKALAEKGAVKIKNFRTSKTKLRYAYVLTPKGIAKRVGLTQRFLARKLDEFERLKAQIEVLREDLLDEHGSQEDGSPARS